MKPRPVMFAYATPGTLHCLSTRGSPGARAFVACCVVFAGAYISSAAAVCAALAFVLGAKYLTDKIDGWCRTVRLAGPAHSACTQSPTRLQLLLQLALCPSGSRARARAGPVCVCVCVSQTWH